MLTGAAKVPSPWPRKTLTTFPGLGTTARSGLPSPLKSPATINWESLSEVRRQRGDRLWRGKGAVAVAQQNAEHMIRIEDNNIGFAVPVEVG